MKSGIFFPHGYKGFYAVDCSPHYQNEIAKHRFGYILIFRWTISSRLKEVPKQRIVKEQK